MSRFGISEARVVQFDDSGLAMLPGQYPSEIFLEQLECHLALCEKILRLERVSAGTNPSKNDYADLPKIPREYQFYIPRCLAERIHELYWVRFTQMHRLCKNKAIYDGATEVHQNMLLD